MDAEDNNSKGTEKITTLGATSHTAAATTLKNTFSPSRRSDGSASISLSRTQATVLESLTENMQVSPLAAPPVPTLHRPSPTPSQSSGGNPVAIKPKKRVSSTQRRSLHNHHNTGINMLASKGDSTTICSSLDDSCAFSMASTRTADQHMTKDSIRAFLVDYHSDLNSLFGTPRDCWESFFEKNRQPHYTHVRNSGNVIDNKGFIDLFCGGVLVSHNVQLVSVDNIILLAKGTVAVATYTVDQIFSYKGVEHSDRCVYTVVLEEVDGAPKMVQEQRSNGMPIPRPETRWQPNAATAGPHKHIVDVDHTTANNTPRIKPPALLKRGTSKKLTTKNQTKNKNQPPKPQTRRGSDVRVSTHSAPPLSHANAHTEAYADADSFADSVPDSPTRRGSLETEPTAPKAKDNTIRKKPPSKALSASRWSKG